MSCLPRARAMASPRARVTRHARGRASSTADSCFPPVGAEAGLRVLTDHEIFRRERRIRRARRYAGWHVARIGHGAQAGRLRRSPRARRRHLSAASRRSSSRRAPSKSRSSSTRAAIASTCRFTASTSSSDTAPRAMSAADAPPPRLHKLGGQRWAQQRDKHAGRDPGDDAELLELYARRQIAQPAAARARWGLAAPARVVVSVRGYAGPAQGDRRREDGYGARSADGSLVGRRRRIRQDGDRRPRGVQGGAVRPPSRPCWSRRRSWPTSICARSAIGSPIFRCGSRR